MKCIICGFPFDPEDLSEALFHEHKDLFVKQNHIISGKRVINHARDIYPDCSNEFACGVHSFLAQEGYPSYYESEEFTLGYWQAQDDDLLNKVIKS